MPVPTLAFTVRVSVFFLLIVVACRPMPMPVAVVVAVAVVAVRVPGGGDVPAEVSRQTGRQLEIVGVSRGHLAGCADGAVELTVQAGAAVGCLAAT